MRITMAQLNPTVGDIEGNVHTIQQLMYKGREDRSDLLVLPELYLTGYPPRDLLAKPWFIERTNMALELLREFSLDFADTGILLGIPCPGNPTGKGLFNSAVLIYRGEIIASQHKSLLPDYDVFDETRYFDPAVDIEPIPFKDELLGVTICEDAWSDPTAWPVNRLYTCDPVQNLSDKGATLFINISASPFYAGKEDVRCTLVQNHAQRHNKQFIYVNQVGANDELIFDGSSLWVNSSGEIVQTFPTFREHIETIDTESHVAHYKYQPTGNIESVYEALVLGIHDYVRKCGFEKVILGLSGGIDSALTACLACAAVGAQNVQGISMPSMYSSIGSVEDSILLAENLGMKIEIISIEKVYNAYMDGLKEHFKKTQPDTAEENLQARIRGNYLMAFSNKFGHLLLSTGNKSEMALGYCTLYGDMSGGLSVLADVPKTMVYQLSHFINRNTEIIPTATISKPPSAELRPEQTDQDELPPYEIIDQILYHYIEQSHSVSEITQMGYDTEVVKWIVKKVDLNEYKRRQAAPVLKVTSKAFGTGRRMPIAAKI